MNRRDFSKNAVLALAAVPFASSLMSFNSLKSKNLLKKNEDENTFNHYSNDNELNVFSSPVFVLTKGEETEVLAFNTSFGFKAGDISKTNSGHRQIGIKVTNWEGEVYSKLLNKKIGFRVIKTYSDSNLTSQFLNKDFPSNLNLKIKYDILLDGEVVKKGAMGRVHSTLEDVLHISKNHTMLVDGGEILIENFKLNFCAA